MALVDHLRIDPTTGCWIWTAATRRHGYGVVKWQGRMVPVHRLAASLWLGIPLDDPRLICHKCDNPPCWNPEHLFAGTLSDNAKDSVAKGRHRNTRKTECKHGHQFTPENTLITNLGRRRCKACVYAHNASWRNSHREYLRDYFKRRYQNESATHRQHLVHDSSR